MNIQMLENPRSIRILQNIKKYHSELKRYIEDTDQWINKQTQPSNRTKYRVTQIFKFFSQICMEKTEEDEYDEEEEADNTNQKGTSVQNET